ncbi:MAG: enoyl-CoA hydratase/isomerase family protein [Bacteroidales bacterium]|nr:enoyl-CoA hydratase/isomerase family protein [Bacteroidales bacterium]
MEYRFLKTEERGPVALLSISAPKTLNALNSQIVSELDHYLDAFDTQRLRCLIVTGDGEKAFVAGADISEMAGLDVPQGRAFGARGAAVFRKLETLPVPVIAAVNGFALGGGCELAMACDIRICSDNAKFGQPEVGLGIIPGFSGTVRLARLVGMGMAKQLIFTGKVIRADEALRIGLVNAVVAQEELMDKALEIANQIAAQAPLAVKAAKSCINAEYDMDADEAIRYESGVFGDCFATEDQKEGMAAFLEKRPAAFKAK